MLNQTVMGTFGALSLAAFFTSCGGKSPAGPSAANSGTTALLVQDVTATASLYATASGKLLGILYDVHFRTTSTSPATSAMKFRRVDWSLIGADGNVYSTTSQTSDVGLPVNMGYSGSPFVLQDFDLVRPVATAFRLSLEYAPDGEAAAITQSVSCSILSHVPPQPYIASMTVSHDIQGAQAILRRPVPVTFTVSHVEGGTPPFLYQWWLNGFLLRDWDPNPVLVWDLNVNGHQIGSGGQTLSVDVRRSTWPEAETGVSVQFVTLF